MQLVRTKRKYDDEEENIYYIYEPRKRQHLESKTKSTKPQPQFTKPDQQFINLASNLTQANLKPTKSLKLFDMCLNFIALNVECIEHLRTLPSLVGEIIFNNCIKLDKFNCKVYRTDLILDCISLFAKAYPHLLIESVNLTDLPPETLTLMATIISECSLKRLNLKNTNLNELCSEVKAKVNLEINVYYNECPIKNENSLKSNRKVNVSFKKLFIKNLGYLFYFTKVF